MRGSSPRTGDVRPWLIDGALALGLTALSLVAVVGGAPDVGARDPLSVALLMLESLPLVARRRFPLAVLAISAGATLAHAALAADSEGVNEGLGSFVALFTVAELHERRVSIPAAVIVGLAFALLIAGRGGIPAGLQGLLSTSLVVAAAWFLGDWTRTRRRFASAIEDRARLLEQEREEQARRAVQDERDRIARELHDIVTHHVSVIVIQAGGAIAAVERRPEQAREALQAIDRTARAALTDMRRMLGILGPGGVDSLAREEPRDPVAAREPMPDLDRLGELVEQVRAAGLPVELAVVGAPRPLDVGVSLSAYRIVQESLTNTLKHARGARASVRLEYEPRSLTVSVQDEGGSGQRDLGVTTGSGRDLIGMRERAALYGGSLDAGPTPNGFRVVARLPLDLPETHPSGSTQAQP
jgi:signal transduction histidine kinase